MRKKRNVVKKVAGLARASSAGRVASMGLSALGLMNDKAKGKPKRRKMTIASIKRKIALLKAKKELAKIRGY